MSTQMRPREQEELSATLSFLEREMKALAPHRSPRLFREFLVKGYSATTLSCVPRESFFRLLQAKLALGTLITLYDDFADRPAQADPHLLERLYELGFTETSRRTGAAEAPRPAYLFASRLFEIMRQALRPLPSAAALDSFLQFDLAQFYAANRLSSLVTAQPAFRNTLENRLYGHHNMGMVMAAMMDLMAVPELPLEDVGVAREIFLRGQRMGRIFNVLATLERERGEGDVTGEIPLGCRGETLLKARGRLRREAALLERAIRGQASRVKSFSAHDYADGLVRLGRLHNAMEGAI